MPEAAGHGFVSDASFEMPQYIPKSAWLGHGPFAFWLTENLKPSTFVELGTHYGYSYFCFCQQILKRGLPTQCAAVDLWTGDEHAGFYGEDVFNTVKKINEQNYSGFSRLIRSTFAGAVSNFEDGSIDLLHVDGRHRYEDVKEDFETWRPKLSDRAVVLFHDTQVKAGDFGVFRYWPEIAKGNPSFEFMHQYGLGVLGVGKNLPAPLKALFDAPAQTANAIRTSYERLGLAVAGKRMSRVEACPCGSGTRFKHCHGQFMTALPA